MILRKAAVLLALSALWQPAHASLITNGDFSTCDLSGWSTDSDGGNANPDDFVLVSGTDGCSVRIYIDQNDTFANTLYQSIDTTRFDRQPLMLSYDFTVNSELTGQTPLSADYFSIGFGNGTGVLYNADAEPGDLFNQPDIDGAMDYQGDILISDTFSSWNILTFEIQLLSNFDASPAWLTVNSISLSPANSQVSVPSPATFPLLLCALGLLTRRSAKIGNNHNEK